MKVNNALYRIEAVQLCLKIQRNQKKEVELIMLKVPYLLSDNVQDGSTHKFLYSEVADTVVGIVLHNTR